MLRKPALKWAIGIPVALFICAAGYFVVRHYTSTVTENCQLKATTETLTATAQEASSATDVALGQLVKLDSLTQEKTRSEEALREDTAAFHRELHQAAGQVPAGAVWLAEPVPAAVVRSLCERTSVRSTDCDRD